MKNKLALLSAVFLLCASLLFSACSPSGQGGKNESGTVGGSEQLPTYPASLVGYWYSAENETVFDFSGDGTLTVYTLTTGYYEYNNKLVYSYTYSADGGSLSIITEEGTDLWTVTSDGSGSFRMDDAAGNTISFAARSTLPEEHVIYNFPDYTSFDFDSILTLPAYRDLTLPLELEEPCLAAALLDYWGEVNVPTEAVSGRSAQLGDYAVIDFVGLLDGVAFENGSGTDAGVWIHSQSGFVEGFAEGIVGHAVGETFDVSLTFPENYYEDLAGKAVVFRMTLKKLYDGIPTDADVKEATEGAYETFSAYRENFRSELEPNRQRELIWSEIFEKTEFQPELPFLSYAFFLQYYQDMYHYYAAYYGTDYETILAGDGLTEERLLSECQVMAKDYLTVHAIAAAEGITYAEEDLDAEIRNAVTSYMEDYQLTEEAALAEVNAHDLTLIRAQLTYDAVIDWLVENNDFVD